MDTQKKIRPVQYKSDESFIGKLQRLVRDEVIPYQYKVLCDEAEGAEKSHVIANFINAGKALKGDDNHDGFYGMVFQDSDAAKWIEAVAYSLTNFPDEELEALCDSVIDIIADAQDKDGYLNTYFTIKDKDKRYKNLMEGHELYCSGHMIEAACAYYKATGKDKLLNVMLKNVDNIYKVFITDKNGGCPGHPEVELALMEMYKTTGEAKCLELAEYFINTRGTDIHFYEREAEARDWTVWGNNPSDYDYLQGGAPVREQTKATGHAVRAVYLYTGMARLALQSGDETLLNACKTLWDNITKQRMYITGGIGSTVLGEAFSVDYDLPSDTAYCETCASIGLMFFAQAMLENETDSHYADIMERAFFNTVLAGMQLDGKQFFYVNPLECQPGISGVAPTHRHDLTQRPKWYACACCPPNTARLIASFGSYAYGENEDTAFCNIPAGGIVTFDNGIELICKTGYPHKLNASYKITKGEGKLAIRIPSWSKSISFESSAEYTIDDSGYAIFMVSEGDVIRVMYNAAPYKIYANTKVPKLTGKTAICRGPLVYCFEGVDNDGDVFSLSLAKGKITKEKLENDELGDIVRLKVKTKRSESIEELYTSEKPKATPYEATAIPYYTWCNRGENQMRIWMD